jgi:NAD(P)-dependent dehydrogenase (short-subunit alcohol dehydrogenase family)
MATNLRAPFLLIQAFARAMLERGVKGSIINVSSGSAGNLRTNGIPYCVSKRGLEWLSKRICFGRLGTPKDVANLVAFLATSEPSFMTGQSIVLDGFQWIA